MIDRAAHAEWIDDDVTREQLAKLDAEVRAAERALIAAARTKGIEDVRGAVRYRDGLMKALQLVKGKAADGED